ncbi:MAG: hemin transporter [Verrucomicrobiales bacterium VVV1]|nr:MAG: hemin transporter [Verrucomicrobiales bacterium VVV1]
MNEASLYASVGEAGITRMVAAFYSRIRTDDLLGPMYPDSDWEGSELRLREFLMFRLGGDTRYVESRGHPRLRMRHMPFSIGIAERDRWLDLMRAAMKEADLPSEAILELDAFFSQVADFMRNREEPAH